jgi:transcriptional regulator with GAF, ATPase, and Fis domain
MAEGQQPPRQDPEVPTDLQGAVQPPFTTTPTFVLTVVEGPDSGASCRLDGAQPSRLLVGQSPACELRLTDSTVSRRHAAFEVTDNELHFSDLGSTNRSYIGGFAVVDAYLHGGEVIRMGKTAIRVERLEGSRDVPMATATRFGRVVGASLEMRRLYPLCQRVAASQIPVVIEGETGTGKEVLAESLHEAGPRAGGPFMVFDCTAVPPSLVESELFGHERGAFTGAVTTRKGIFEQAHGGTLFIDEIGDLDIALQPKLLRAIERSEVRRVGGDRWLPVDVRIVAATRRDLDREVQAGRFRDDLFFRLAVARIELPPLRARRGDVAVLASHFWKRLGGADGSLPFELLRQYEDYGWPGNVRELHNAVARRLALGDTEPQRSPKSAPSEPAVGVRSGGDFIDDVVAMQLSLPNARQRVIDELERRYVERVVALHGGNISRAAAASGLAHRYFQKIRARLGKT